MILVGHMWWIVGGDLNIILTLEEKRGGKKRLEQYSFTLRNLIEHLKLVDIKIGNGSFTWSNKRSSP